MDYICLLCPRQELKRLIKILDAGMQRMLVGPSGAACREAEDRI